MSIDMTTIKLCIFDVDGTLTITKSGATFRKSAQDWQWLPGRLSKLHRLKEQGVRLAIATNQGGVAFGYFEVADILRELQAMARIAGIPKGGLYICYTHPKASREHFRAVDDRRKPGPGMLLEAMRDFEAEAEETLMVGDLSDDEVAASVAGCHFAWAGEFFKEETNHETPSV